MFCQTSKPFGRLPSKLLTLLVLLSSKINAEVLPLYNAGSHIKYAFSQIYQTLWAKNIYKLAVN